MATNRKKLIKKLKRNHKVTVKPSYIEQMKHYADLFSDFGQITFLINNVLISNQLLSEGNLPQDLPILMLPDDIQDQIYQAVNAKYAPNDPKGDQVWNQYVDALPKLDHLLRSYRDYIEQQYGMWAYISAPFVKSIAEFTQGKRILEVMAGNGYISKGLRNLGADVIATDSLEWTKENQTGRHLVTKVERLSAIDAFQRYQDQVDVIIMAWAPDGLPIDWELLQAIRASKPDVQFIVIGERNGATNSKAFWEHAEFVEPAIAKQLNQHHQPFDLIHDQLFLVK